jgi:predicted RNase H-like nuclease (RuvC/YqgF family)
MQDAVALAEIGPFMERHRRLEALGFDEATAEAVAAAVTAAGAVGERRAAALGHIADAATATVDREELEETRQALQEEVATLEARTAQLERVVQALTEQRERFESEMDTAGQRLADTVAESAAKVGDLHVLQALRRVLLGKTADVEAFFQDLRNLDQWRRLGGSPDDRMGKPHVKGLQSKLIAFIQNLVKEPDGTR